MEIIRNKAVYILIVLNIALLLLVYNPVVKNSDSPVFLLCKIVEDQQFRRLTPSVFVVTTENVRTPEKGIPSSSPGSSIGTHNCD